MKLHANTHTIEKSGDFEENQFSIEASAKAFMILSDGLYSNKILAVFVNCLPMPMILTLMRVGGIVPLKYTSLPVLNLSSMFVTLERACRMKTA
jgi:hypothetical protein